MVGLQKLPETSFLEIDRSLTCSHAPTYPSYPPTMKPAARSRPLQTALRRYSLRALLGSLALLSLLVSHQLIWSGFEGITRLLPAPRIWVISKATPDADPWTALFSDRVQKLTVEQAELPLQIIAPPN